MKDFDLTNEEVQELRFAHKSAKHKRDAYRINAVILLGTGWLLSEVVDALLLDDETLRKYVENYRAGGLKKLLDNNYKGGFQKLSIQDCDALSAELEQNIYLNTKSICEYVFAKFNTKYSISGMTALLHRLGYVYKKPKLVPANPDEDAQEYFLQEYIRFMKNKRENDAVFFVDAVHPTWNSMATYGWMKKGMIRELKSNSGREKVNIHGAMNAETFETTIISSESNVNSDSTIALFEALETTYKLAANIYVILDNARYHFSASVMEYVATSRIKMIFLPSYSPELNLIERLWKVFKKNVIYNKFYSSFKEFKKSCMHFFMNQSDHLEEIQLIMGDGLEAFA